MEDRDAYDMLLAPGPGWSAQTTLIVSPYVETTFFERLGRQLRPDVMHVVIDDGCRREDPGAVRDALKAGGHRGRVHLRLGSARGLVHLKLFYTRWRSAAGRSAHTLVFGSANATRQGFDGDVNAELLAACRLRAREDRRLISWCERVIAATELDAAVEIAGEREGTAGGVAVRLPAMTVVTDARGSRDFDLWIQRGSLLSEFRPDPAFLQIPIHAAKPLDPDQQATAAESAGFEVRLTRSIRHRYIDDGSREEESEAFPPRRGSRSTWRRRLFTRTDLGEWCSSECVEAHGGGFLRGGHERRQEALDELRSLSDEGARKRARGVFLDRMDALWTALGDDAASVLRSGSDGLDRGHYRSVFDAKVGRDLRLVGDEEYARRYVRGFELVDVPRFRNDVPGWRAFVGSLAQELSLEAMRGRTRSRLVRAIGDAFEEEGVDEITLLDPEALLDSMRRTFEGRGRRKRRAARIITEYHAQD